jgi:ankyrin repeat protein
MQITDYEIDHDENKEQQVFNYNILTRHPNVLLHILQYMTNQEIYDSFLTVNQSLYQLSLKALDTTVNDQYAIKYACANNLPHLLSQLLNDVRVNPHVDDNTPLLIACDRGNVSVVKQLLTKVNPTNESLLVSCRQGHAEIVKLFLSDPRIDISEVYNLALQMASENNHNEVVRLLQRRSSLLRPLILILNAITVLLLILLFVFPDSFKSSSS